METSFEDEAGWDGLRVWAESREAQASRRTGRVRFTAAILTQVPPRTRRGGVSPARRSAAPLVSEGGRQPSDFGCQAKSGTGTDLGNRISARRPELRSDVQRLTSAVQPQASFARPPGRGVCAYAGQVAVSVSPQPPGPPS